MDLEATGSVDVVRADGNISPSAKCSICRRKIAKTDAVIRIEQFQVNIQLNIHRRCMEATLEVSVEDAPTEERKFRDYRAAVAEKHDLVLIG